MAKEYWENRFNEWKSWMRQGSNEKDFPWNDWNYPNDVLRKENWHWQNCRHSAHILPEPYWGNPIDPSIVFVNINPGKVDALQGVQANFSNSREDISYYHIASRNHLHLNETQKWHQNRFNWANEFSTSIDSKKGLSIELIPWHSKSASDVTNYIIENRQAVIENLIRFSKILPKTGVFKNTFIVRSAAFMNLLDNQDFASYFHIEQMKHHVLAKSGHIDKPISFMSILNFKDAYDSARFIVFHGGSNNQLPSKDYVVLETGKSLKAFLSE
jgi:hypothetical protein